VIDVREDLTVLLSGIDIGRLLECWRWLIPDDQQPLFATALGDLFMAGRDGSVRWLDMGDGQLQTVAASEPEFWQAAAIEP
jgi:hypothetical protein